MTSWAGFWLALAIVSVGEMWYSLRRKELQKKGVKFKWWD